VYTFASILLGLGYFSWRKSKSFETELAEISQQGTVYSIADLHKLRKQGGHDEILNGKRYCLISGTIARKKFTSDAAGKLES